ncbi:uncharacterized protein RB166_020172 isoform 1-T2 [Leptodactylus fuscus]|uniref:uncharacterized protein LOC142184356 n=1 Tax=Leptodactylus fuscus TaxID=238119 RepID=UPI003F4E728C
MARLSAATRHKIVTLRQQGLSQSKISKQTGVSRCAVQALLKKHQETGNVEDRTRSGRPRKLTAADEMHIVLTSLQNRKKSSSAIRLELAETSGTLVHPSTVRRSLARSGLYGGVTAKRPDLQHAKKYTENPTILTTTIKEEYIEDESEECKFDSEVEPPYDNEALEEDLQVETVIVPGTSDNSSEQEECMGDESEECDSEAEPPHGSETSEDDAPRIIIVPSPSDKLTSSDRCLS